MIDWGLQLLLTTAEMVWGGDMGDMEIPFTTDNFLATFSKPNFYFHATTTYTILRAMGVPLGKMDYLGTMSIGH